MAGITNGGFETGDATGWTTFGGSASMLTSSMGVTPPEGTYAFILSTSAATKTVAQLEAELGLSAGAFDALGLGTVIDGGYTSQAIAVTGEGDFAIRYNMLTTETGAPGTDFVFTCVIDGDGVRHLSAQVVVGGAWEFANTPLPLGALYPYSAGWFAPGLWHAEAAGTYTIAIGVVNVFNATGRSAVCVDDLTFSGPMGDEPASALPFSDCGTYLGASECEVRIYDPTGYRTNLSCHEWLESVEWEVLERGGYGTGTIHMLAAWEDLEFAGNERVDIMLFNNPAYRGWVRVAERTIGDPERCSPRLYGLMEILDHWTVTRKFAYGCATDISEVFEDILDHVLTTSRKAAIAIMGSGVPVVEKNAIGVTIFELDARGKGAAQAINQLCDMAPYSAIWGADFSATPNWRGLRENRLYIRTRPTTVTHAFAIGDNVTAMTYPPDTTRIVNRLRLTGGKVRQPNLISNGSFENLMPAGDLAGNMIWNPGFEDEGLGSAWKVGAGDPTIMAAGDPGASGSSRTDNHWLEIDTVDEEVYQDVNIVTESAYTASCWARCEDYTVGGSSSSFVLYLQGLNAADGVVTSDFVVGSLASDVYARFSVSKDWAGSPTVVKARIRLVSQGGAHANDGTLVDDTSLYLTCGNGHDDWRVWVTGDATIGSLDWASTDVTAKHGALCTAVEPADIALNADTVVVFPWKKDWPAVNPLERYTLLVWYHVAGAGGGGDETIMLRAELFNADGSAGTVHSSMQFSGNPSSWTLKSLGFVTDANTANLRPDIYVLSNRKTYLDAVMLVQGEVPPEVTSDGVWWDADQYEAVIDVTDAALTGLTTAAATSISTYGEREATVTQEQVTDRASLLEYAEEYLNAHAVPEVQGNLTIMGPRELLNQDGRVRLINLPSGPQPLFPSRVRYRVGEAVELEADLGNDVADLTDLLRFSAARARQGL